MTLLESYWPTVPEKFKYLTHDVDGVITAFTHAPYFDEGEWFSHIYVRHAEFMVISSNAEHITEIQASNSLIKRGE